VALHVEEEPHLLDDRLDRGGQAEREVADELDTRLDCEGLLEEDIARGGLDDLLRERAIGGKVEECQLRAGNRLVV
jgi:hypothetical protein